MFENVIICCSFNLFSINLFTLLIFFILFCGCVLSLYVLFQLYPTFCLWRWYHTIFHGKMKRKKGSRHSKGFRKQRENKKSSGGDLLGAEEDGLFVLGYACNFHRNTELYNTTESGSLLQTWHDDSTLLLDRCAMIQFCKNSKSVCTIVNE